MSLDDFKTDSDSMLNPNWEPESPFLNETVPKEKGEPQERQIVESLTPWNQLESPFLSVYEFEADVDLTQRGNDEFMELVSELYDSEFDDAVSQLLNEASDLMERKYDGEFGTPITSIHEMEGLLMDHFSPLIREAEMLFERVEESLEKDVQDITAMNDSELETFLDRFEPDHSGLSPIAEDFLKKLWKKAKKVVKKVVKKVKKGIKKGIKLIKKLSPINLILKKLKKFVKPLLKRVLKFALNRIPPTLQPIVKRLAGNFLKEVDEETNGEENEEPESQIGWIQGEFDLQLSNLVLSLEELEVEKLLEEYITEVEAEEPAPTGLEELENARESFIKEITQLQEGEDPSPHIENFVQAILMALKVGIKLIGRKRVINFLAKLLGKLIGRFVGKKYTPILSKAIVNAGFGLLGLEVSGEEESDAAGSAVASTVEETVRQVALLPEYILEDEALLEAYVLDIFETAAAGNFPDSLLKPELRETAELAGTWVSLPQKKRKYYKKYTRILDITITPQIAGSISTFGNKTLKEFLQARLGNKFKDKISARVHLYESIPGTWLSRISKYERKVPGLGSADKASWSQIHPLTPEVAGLLLRQPGLGHPVSPKFLKDRNTIGIGQRFYYLELYDSPRPILTGRTSEVNMEISFPGRMIRIFIFLSEAQAQDIAVKLRQGVSLGSIIKTIKSIYEGKLTKPSFHARIIHEAYGPELLSLPGISGINLSKLKFPGKSNITGKVKEHFNHWLVEKIIHWLAKAQKSFLEKGKQEFIKTAEDPADGVTLIVSFTNLAVLDSISKVLKGKFQDLKKVFPKKLALPDYTVQLKPGYYNGRS